MEIEFKFRIAPERLAAVQAAMRGPGSTRTRLQARYFDTAAGDLAALGIALRLRKEGRRWVQTAKALGDGPVQRLEHNVDLGLQRRGSVFTADPARHDGTPVGERLSRALASLESPLVEVYGTDIWRVAREVRHGNSRIELALDLGQVLAPSPTGDAPRGAAVCELELELLEGSIADLAALSAAWATEHQLWFSTVTKSEQGLRLARGVQVAPAVKAGALRLADPADGAGIQRAVVGACLAHILPNATEIAEGSEDIEQIHQLRVGLRRLRTALRELAPLGPGLNAAWMAPLTDCFRALGARRDAQQIAQTLLPQLRAAGAPPLAFPAGAVSSGQPRWPEPTQAVRAVALQAVLVALVACAAGDASGDTAGDAACTGATASEARSMLRRRLRTLYQRLLKESHDFSALPEQQQHQSRKRLKRLRYLAEFVGPLFDGKHAKDGKNAQRAQAFVRGLTPAQDALGEHQDGIAARDAFMAATSSDPQAWFAVGWFAARLPASARSSQKALRALGDLPLFWKKRG